MQQLGIINLERSSGLMSRIHNFIEMTFLNQRKRLWKEGVSTLAYVSPEASFSKEKRFKLHSIYWPQKSESAATICKTKSSAAELGLKISKMIDDEQRNQRRIRNGKRLFRKTIKSTNNKETVNSLRETKTTKLSQKNEEVIGRLTWATPKIKQPMLRDRHGNRTNLLENIEGSKDELFEKVGAQNFWATEKGFSTSRRMNLELPDNYYPGPGSYDIQRYLDGRNQVKKQKGVKLQQLKE